MAAPRDDWQADWQRVISSDQWKTLEQTAPEVLQQERLDFFNNRVKLNPAYQHGSPQQRQQIEMTVLGGSPEVNGPSVPVGTGVAQAASGPPLPGQPFPSIGPPPEANPLKPNVRGQLATMAARGSQVGDWVRNQLNPGGLASPEVQGAAGGEMLAEGAAQAFGMPPPVVMGAGVLGSTVGAPLGRGYELATGASPMPDTWSGVLGDLGEASKRGALQSMGGKMAQGTLSYLGGKVFGLRPPAPEAQQVMEAAGRQNVEMTAGQVTGRTGLMRLEEVPRVMPMGGAKADVFMRNQRQQLDNRLLELADEISPGASRDHSIVGTRLQSSFGEEKAATRQAGISLFNHSKDIMQTKAPDGLYATPNLAEAAQGVYSREQPMTPFRTSAYGKAQGVLRANEPPPPPEPGTILDASGNPMGPIHQGRPMGVTANKPLSQETVDALRRENYDPGAVYTYPELLDLSQRLGKAKAAATDPKARAELAQMWNASLEDLSHAADVAGAPEAKVVLDQAKRYWREEVIGLYNDPKLLRVMVKQDPSQAVKTLISPSTTYEQLVRVRNAINPSSWEGLRQAWFDRLSQDSMDTATGQFSSANFNSVLANIQPENLKLLAGSQWRDLRDLIRVNQHVAANTLNPGSRGSLTMGQLLGATALASGVLGGGGYTVGGTTGGLTGTMAGTSLPFILSSLLYSKQGVRWLTIGLKAPVGSAASAKAVAKLAGIVASRPNKMAMSRNAYQAFLGPLPTPAPGPTPTPTPGGM